MGGETPAMVMTEAITRLIPGVIKEEQSRQDDSYTQHTDTIEWPHYTKPEQRRGYNVPDVLLSGHHARIDQRRQQTKTTLDDWQ